jgi:hypothetical protein
MPYLRLLTNALVAGALGAMMLVHVLLLLNPHVPLRPEVLFSIGWRVAATAGAMLTASFFLASLARYLSTRRGPGWLSLRLLAWMTTLVVSLGTLLAWLNLSAYGPSLSPPAERRFALATATLAATGFVLLVIALVHYGFGRRGSRVGGALLGIAVVAAVVLPLVARGPGDPRPVAGHGTRVVDASLREPPAGRVWLVLLDGASLDYASPAAAQGRLPNLGRLLDGGASLTLFSIEPRHPAPIWTSVATGRYPHGHAITSEARHRGGWAELDLLPRYVFADLLVLSGLIERHPVESGDLRGAPLWQVLDASAVPVLIVDWPFASGASLRTGRVLRTASAGNDPIDADRERQLAFDRAVAAASYQVAAVRYSALWALGPEGLTRPSAVRGRRTIDEAYDAIDQDVGRILEQLLPDDLLLVVSGYRLEPASPFERLRARLVDDAGLAAEANRSDGFLLAYGRHVSPGRKTVGAIVDVLPTVLYYLGLPVARDMEGFARTDLFTATLTTERPVSFIRSYQ